MTGEFLFQMVCQVGIIPALFIWLLYDTRKEHREQLEKSELREQSLMDHISKSDETQRKICESLNSLDKSLMFLQKDVELLKKGN